jgi:hemoglobin
MKRAFAVVMALAIALTSVNADARKRHRRRHRRHEPRVVAEKSLFERLGGRKTLDLVVEDGLKRVAQDPRLVATFEKFGLKPGQASSKIGKIKAQLVEQLCAAAGGPCRYGGPPMAEARRSLALSDEQFLAAAESLSDALEEKGVPEREKNELLAIVGELRPALVMSSSAISSAAALSGAPAPGALPAQGGSAPPAAPEDSPPGAE